MEKRHYDKWNAYECAEKEIDKNTHNWKIAQVMTDSKIQIVITARDAASGVFVNIASATRAYKAFSSLVLGNRAAALYNRN